MVDIIPSSRFKKAVKHLNTQQKEKLEKIIRKILKDPAIGKPLKYGRGERSIKINPFHLILRKDTQTLYLLKFEHRDSVYK